MNSDGRVRVDSEFLFFSLFCCCLGTFTTHAYTHTTLYKFQWLTNKTTKKKSGNPLTTIFFFIFIFIFDNTFSYKSNQINKPRQPRQPRQPSTSTATTLERKVFNKRINTQTHIYNKVQTRYFAHFDIISIILLLL